MKKFIIALLLSLLLHTVHANDTIFISPKIALKMIDKKEFTFIGLDNASLKIKESKTLDSRILESSDILGHMDCAPFYVCSQKVEKYFSTLDIESNDALIIYDDSYGINAATLYVVLESMGHKNISILRGSLASIEKLDPNWKIYNSYLKEFKLEDLNKTFSMEKDSKINEIVQKINILKPHILLEEASDTAMKYVESNYTATKITSKYFLSKKALKEVVHKVRGKESNISIIDACEMIDIVGSDNGSYTSGVKFLSWKELIDKKMGHLKSNEKLEKLFKRLKLSKNDNNYIYCMSGAQKAFYVMIILRELGYDKVKAYTGDWNTWVGDIDE